MKGENYPSARDVTIRLDYEDIFELQLLRDTIQQREFPVGSTDSFNDDSRAAVRSIEILNHIIEQSK